MRSGEGCSMGTTAETVAVAVGRGNCRSSRRAVRWAVENLMPFADRILLIHVAPSITSIPAPSGRHVPIKEVPGDMAKMYIQDTNLKFEEIFLPYKRLCKKREVQTLVLSADDPSAALLRYLSESDTKTLVLGSSFLHFIARKLRGPGLSSTILKLAPNNCNIYVVSRYKLKKKLADLFALCGSDDPFQTHQPRPFQEGMWPKIISKRVLCGSDRKTNLLSSNSEASLETVGYSELSDMLPQSLRFDDSLTSDAGEFQQIFPFSFTSDEYGEENQHCIENSLVKIQIWNDQHTVIELKDHSFTLQVTKQAFNYEKKAEIDNLRLELKKTFAMYNQACKDLVYARNKVKQLLTECSNDSEKVKDALKREEILIKTAAEEKARHMEAIKEVGEARQLLAKEVYERQRAEINAFKESFEKDMLVESLIASGKSYMRYSKDEIEAATDSFSEAKKIGEGAYGIVYKCNLVHTPVAVKVLHQDASDKKDQFLKEVEILGQLRHPRMVLLLGACPENASLVYEYMENGSLEDRIFRQGGTPPLPWFIRFRIVFEIACGLAFLHSSKPEPIVHRDLKPGNILLDKYYSSKIGDVGLAKLISNVVPDSVTEYKDTVLAGTFFYMDPEYHRTGTVRPKSDLYAFGIIILQLLTAKHPQGLVTIIENAVDGGLLEETLDSSIKDWPLAETEKLARLALQCSALRCRDRPDLESEVMPILEELLYIADVHCRLQKCNLDAPSHFFCPILQEVMDDPHVAADGFTYEHRAIKAWFQRQRISPVTKLTLQNTLTIPNFSLRKAIQEWRARSVGTP